MGWNPIGVKEHYTVKGAGGDGESEKKLDCGRVAVVTFLPVIIGIAIHTMARHPGVLELAKSLVMGIWDMLCNIANAFGDFMEYVKRQRSS